MSLPSLRALRVSAATETVPKRPRTEAMYEEGAADRELFASIIDPFVRCHDHEERILLGMSQYAPDTIVLTTGRMTDIVKNELGNEVRYKYGSPSDRYFLVLPPSPNRITFELNELASIPSSSSVEREKPEEGDSLQLKVFDTQMFHSWKVELGMVIDVENERRRMQDAYRTFAQDPIGLKKWLVETGTSLPGARVVAIHVTMHKTSGAGP